MNDSDKTREELVEELSAMRGRMAELQKIEKAKAEEKGRQGDDYVRELAAHLRQVLWAVDATGAKVRYFSPAYEKIWGRTCQSLFDNPRSFEDSIHPDDKERVVRALAMRHETERYEEEFRILRPDGSMRWIWDRGYPVQHEQPTLQGFVGIAEDITERKANEDDRSRLAAIVEFSEDAIVSTTGDGIILSWNHGAERLYGYSPKEMIGQSISILFPPDHFQEYLEIMEKIKKGISVPSYETVRRRKDGTEVNVSVGISPIKKREGEIVEASVITRNITERKASEEQMRLLLESTGEGIYGIDIQGRCTFINQAAAAMLGYAPAEVIGQDMHALIHHHRPDGSPYPVEQSPIIRAMHNRQGVRLQDEVLWRKDGTFFAAEYSSFPLKRETVLGAVVTFRDITQTRQLEEQFRQAQKMDAIGRLAGGVAHDFNNLLTIISGYSELLLTALPSSDPTWELLMEIKKAGQRAASLTRQLLAFSRKQILEHKVLDLNSVVTDSEKMFMRLVGEDIDLVTVLDPALGKVKTDLGQMEQVLMNLVVNARDAMPQGGKITIETANVVLDETYCRSHPEVEAGRHIMLALSDNGCGMDQQTRARIFEPFFTTKEPGKGTGLGLAMVHGFIKQSGGHVAVYSEPGVGSTFKIYFPEVEATQSSAQSHVAIEMPHGDETILVVEDEAGVRALTRHVLQTCGYTVLEAARGGEAIRFAEEHQGSIHLLITDVVMPGMGGRLVAERVVALKPDTKVLYLSGYTDDAVVRHGILQSEIAFLQKPFTPSALAAKVREVLDQSEPPPSRASREEVAEGTVSESGVIPPIRALLVDDHSILRAGIRKILQGLPGVEVVAEAADGREALTLVCDHQPDVVFMDIAMAGLNGLEATARLTKEFPDVRVIILSMYADEEHVWKALRAGAAGYLLKHADSAEIEMALRKVARGESYITPAVSKHIVAEFIRRGGNEASSVELHTSRQREILQLLAEGKNAKEIARMLSISAKTAEAHRAQIMERLDIHDLTGLVRYAIRVGLIQPDA